MSNRIYPRKSKETFIAEAKLKHQGTYSYDRVEFVDMKTKVNITCTRHGDFLQPPSRHLRGNGCPKCAQEERNNNNRKSLSDVIKDFKKVHGDRYGYSKVQYEDVVTQIEIICKDHGSFFQRPNDHLHKRGCPKCARENVVLSKESFVKISNDVHNNRYTYDNSVYVNNSTKIKITCPKHGEFEQLPSNHMRGRGCQKCATVQRKQYHKSNRKTQEQFISECNEVHNSKYDYSLVKYKTTNDKIIIICPDHGTFEQKATNHLHMKQGCPKCAESGCYSHEVFNNTPHLKHKDGLLYFVKFYDDTEEFYKIGITKRNIKQRFRHVNHYNMKILKQWDMKLYDAFVTEQHILKTFSDHQHFPKHRIGGDTECFKLDQQGIDNIIQEVYTVHIV